MASHPLETSRSRGKRFEEKDEQEQAGQRLLPAIPDEISVDLIAAKFLSWRDICTMSSVSRGWHQAVRSRQVYEARVRSKSTETLVVHNSCPISYSTFNELSLQSMKENSSHQLPPIPGREGIPLGCDCVSLDGKFYILGGYMPDLLSYSPEVYVLDLAGQRRWKRCASMEQEREGFRCGVLEGKIYAFGFVSKAFLDSLGPVCVCVYDPKEDTWFHGDHLVATVGDHVVDGRYCFTSQESGSSGRQYPLTNPAFVEAYHPDKHEWRMRSNIEDGITWADSSNVIERRGRRIRLTQRIHISV